jgi:hypothetical protein
MVKKSLALLLFILFSGLPGFSGETGGKPEIKKAVYFDVSPALRDMINLPEVRYPNPWKDGVVKNMFNSRQGKNNASPIPDFTDLSSLQNYQGFLLTDTTLQNFDGLGGGSFIPPDTDGDVSADYYFQVVNASYAIYNKSGMKIFGPVASSTVWTGMPHNTNSGDAVVLFDENANRWMFTQFSLPNFPNGPFYQMIAVSQTPDPTGSWYRWQYQFTSMPDYPKFGVWPDGYYMSCNRFSAGSTNYSGTGAAAFDRTLMLAGDPDAQMIYFTLSANNEAFSLLPSDCDGNFPPIGTPNFFTYEYDGSPYHLGILEFHADWATPSNSSFGNLLSLPVNNFNPNQAPIPQKGTSAKLGTLSDRLMFRLQFRKFNDHWSMVCNHTVNSGSNVAGIRWYELRKTTGAWSVYQQSTYAPGDGKCRWMASMAMDSSGNIAMGYSISSSTMFPSIRYTGRLKTDPLNVMTISEKGIINGGGCQTSSTNRWGDYSSMRVDPSSPTTFWYTTEYYAVTSSSSWQTRIASFTFENVFSSYATVGPELICNGDSIQLNAVAYGGSGNYTYSWSSIPPGFTSTEKSPKVTPAQNTTYVALISDGTHTNSDTTAMVDVKQPATAFAGNDTTVCSYLPSIDLFGTATNYRTMGWTTSGDGHFSNNTSLNTTYIFGPEDYLNDTVDLILVAIPFPPCHGKAKSTIHIQFDPCTGLSEPVNNNVRVFVQPNPAHDITTVIIEGLNGETGELSVINTDGQALYFEKVSTSEKRISKKIGLENFASGIYIIQVRTSAGIVNKKLVIQ